MRQVHVIGAGMAGLACAVELARRGVRPVVHESALQAGGRCRSFFDEGLGRVVDNGNHLLLSGNRAVRALVQTVGAPDGLHIAAEAEFPFVHLGTGERWTLRPNPGRLPWWLLSSARRAPGTVFADYLAALKLRHAGGRTVGQLFDRDSAAWHRFWEPLTVAVLNTAAEEADAGLLWPVMVETFLAGGAACRPMIARRGLSDALVDPAVDWLRGKGVQVRLGHRLKGLEAGGSRLAGLLFDDGPVRLATGDCAVLAVPPTVASQLLPDRVVPDDFRTIVNGHFVLDRQVAPEGRPGLLGIVGGTAQWLFLRGDVVSVTVSAADDLAELRNEAIAQRLWQDVCQALSLKDAPPPKWRVVKEKRATFAQTPEQVKKRPPARTPLANLFLAGDWTDTGLPATIEGAVRSGVRAAELAAGK